MASRYQYETSPRKVEPEYQPSKRQKVSKQETQKVVQNAKEKVKARKQEQRKQRRIILYVTIIFGILLAVSYRNSLINENFAKVKSLKAELSAVQKENQQLQVNIESSQNLNALEQSAKERLGMQRLDNTQKIYINLPKKDYVEPGAEEVEIGQTQNWWQKLWNQFLGK